MVRDVVLYTAPTPDHPSYAKTWSYLRFVLSALLHPQAVPYVSSAFASLPPPKEDDMADDQRATWTRILHTVAVFEKAHSRFVEHGIKGMCDNIEV